MKDWMQRADQAVEEGDVGKLIFCLGMARAMMRLEHEDEIRSIIRRRKREGKNGSAIPPSDGFFLSSDSRLCESPRMVTQPLPERRPGG